MAGSPITRVDASNAEAKFEDAMDWARDANRDVRVRVEFRLYNFASQRYVGWPDANWTLDVKPEAEHGKQLLDAFEAFSDVLSTVGPERATAALRKVIPR